MFIENSLDFLEKIFEQRRCIREFVGSPCVSLGSMPVIVLLRSFLKSRALCWHLMCIVKSNKPCSIRCMESHGIIQTVWSFIALLGTFELEFEPISSIEMMDTSVVT